MFVHFPQPYPPAERNRVVQPLPLYFTIPIPDHSLLSGLFLCFSGFKESL